ncbi:serine hydrolase [Hymenobacter psychrophilus]|uniref:Beta-lactamase enzyme family protein n=1 Tax=Hymenobacter psychrophilus TaxID=651662 RepID=A0A1H3GRN6_9BACT|nr:serine hydrolase [Hymenobacter psychrophilus]SDY05625.1 Beta-lactamase enzyme family protein [Hymenobacter psychrophilus]
MRYLFLCLLLAATSAAHGQNPLPRLLRTNPELAAVARQAGAHRLQILYTQIRRDKQGRPHFRSYGYRLRPGEYFYPASAIKLPAALLALEKVHDLRQKQPELRSNSPLRIAAAGGGQTAVERDTTSADGRASLAHYVRKVLLVSDNDAYNRLYEFVGPAGLQQGLRQHGLRRTVLRHRLSVGDQDPAACHTNPLALYTDTALTRPLYVQPAAYFGGRWPPGQRRGRLVGTAYLEGQQKIDKPFDFSTKNATTLADLQRSLQLVLFPETVAPAHRLRLDSTDRRLLLDNLYRLPRQSRFPRYPAAEYPDNYGKFLLAGGPAGPLPAGVRIYNKIGLAYGFLIDNAYLVNPETGVEFMLSAVIYVNSDGVLNDDKYDYDSIGFPFLRRLGEVVYEYEKNRRK